MAQGPFRWRVWSGPDTKSTPTAGGRVDTVNAPRAALDFYGGASPGRRHRMECGGSFSTGDDLATDGNGRAVQAGSGDTVVARALEGSSGAGDSAWVVMVSQS